MVKNISEWHRHGKFQVADPPHLPEQAPPPVADTIDLLAPGFAAPHVHAGAPTNANAIALSAAKHQSSDVHLPQHGVHLMLPA